jgi:hypothetical protein
MACGFDSRSNDVMIRFARATARLNFLWTANEVRLSCKRYGKVTRSEAHLHDTHCTDRRHNPLLLSRVRGAGYSPALDAFHIDSDSYGYLNAYT